MDSAYYELLRRLSQPIRAAALPQTLDPVRRLLDALGQPETGYRAVVVTGSTGKGTTCLHLAYSLRVAGLKVGLYTSPHLHSFRERCAILEPATAATPRLITQAEFVEQGSAVLAAEQPLDHAYSTFESTTALALRWFAHERIDIAVLEVGIGGRFDAVNAVAHELAVFTPIEAEHAAMLGGSLESVAWHKAGIIPPGGAAISAPQTPAVLAVLEREAREKGAALQIVESAAGYFAAPDANPEMPALPGRLERVRVAGRSVIIDGGHTPNAARYLRQFIGAPESLRMIVGMLRDKDAAAYLSVFDAPNVHYVYTRAPGDRGLTARELLERYRPAQASVTLTDTLAEALAALETAPEPLIVVAGSLRLAAAVREACGLLTPDELDEARRTRALFEGADYQGKLEKSPSQ